MSALRKLMAVRMALQATKIKETGKNLFSNYDYLQLCDFLPVAQRLCSEHRLCGVVSFGPELATLTLTDLDDETSQVVITSPMGSASLKGCHEVQNVGAVETYQRRYLWVAALEIVEHDALDSGPPAEKKYTGPAAEPKSGISAERLAELDDCALTMIDAHRGGNDLAAFELYYGLQDNEEKLHVWGLLKAESKLRAAIKANKPKEEANV